MDVEIKHYFPEQGKKLDRQSAARLDRRRKLLIAQIELRLNTESEEAHRNYQSALSGFLKADKPMIFTPNHVKNVLVLHQKAFQNTLTILQENGCKDTAGLTAFELLTKMEFYQKRNETTPDAEK